MTRLATAIAGALALAPAPASRVPAYKPGLLIQIRVADLERSVRFYTDTLGFKVTERRDDLQFIHVDCGIPGLQLGLSAGSARPVAPGTMILNFDVRGDVDEARRLLESRGVAFDGPTQVIPGKVRLAEFKDPDGYVIRLAGEDPPRP